MFQIKTDPEFFADIDELFGQVTIGELNLQEVGFNAASDHQKATISYNDSIRAGEYGEIITGLRAAMQMERKQRYSFSAMYKNDDGLCYEDKVICDGDTLVQERTILVNGAKKVKRISCTLEDGLFADDEEADEADCFFD